jgi:hypothetical protein
VHNAIDWILFKADDLRVFYSTPMLAFAECVQSDGRVDSDIQRDFSNCGINDIDKFEEDWWKAKIGESNVTNDSDINKVSILPVSQKIEMERTKNYVWYKGSEKLFIVPFKFCDEEFLSTHPIFDHRFFLDE